MFYGFMSVSVDAYIKVLTSLKSIHRYLAPIGFIVSASPVQLNTKIAIVEDKNSQKWNFEPISKTLSFNIQGGKKHL